MSRELSITADGRIVLEVRLSVPVSIIGILSEVQEDITKVLEKYSITPLTDASNEIIQVKVKMEGGE